MNACPEYAEGMNACPVFDREAQTRGEHVEGMNERIRAKVFAPPARTRVGSPPQFVGHSAAGCGNLYRDMRPARAVILFSVALSGCAPWTEREQVIARHQGSMAVPNRFWGGTFGISFDRREQLRDNEFVKDVYPALKKFPNLNRLSLSGTEIGDESVKAIATLQTIDVLWLHDTKVTIAGLRMLAALPRLTHLSIPSSITDNELSELSFLLPSVKISRRES